MANHCHFLTGPFQDFFSLAITISIPFRNFFRCNFYFLITGTVIVLSFRYLRFIEISINNLKNEQKIVYYSIFMYTQRCTKIEKKKKVNCNFILLHCCKREMNVKSNVTVIIVTFQKCLFVTFRNYSAVIMYSFFVDITVR